MWSLKFSLFSLGKLVQLLISAASSGNLSLNDSPTDQHSKLRACFSNSGLSATSPSVPSIVITASIASYGQFNLAHLAYISEKSLNVYLWGFCIKTSRTRGPRKCQHQCPDCEKFNAYQGILSIQAACGTTTCSTVGWSQGGRFSKDSRSHAICHCRFVQHLLSPISHDLHA